MRPINTAAERDFENLKSQSPDVRIAQLKYAWATDPSNEAHRQRISRAILGRRVLEIGCSSGGLASILAPSCGSYVGIDISDKAVEAARLRSLGNAEFLVCDAHKIPFPDQEFDCVIVDALLHHMDLDLILPEIHRVLKLNGLFFFNEPLGMNPAFNLYRRMTPSARTADERPFTRLDWKNFTSMFDVEDVSFFGGVVLLSAFVQNKSLRRFLTTLDKLFFRGPFRYFAWQVAGVATIQPSGLN